MATGKVSADDYVGALAALAKASTHAQKVLDHIEELVAMYAEIELSYKGD